MSLRRASALPIKTFSLSLTWLDRRHKIALLSARAALPWDAELHIIFSVCRTSRHLDRLIVLVVGGFGVYIYFKARFDCWMAIISSRLINWWWTMWDCEIVMVDLASAGVTKQDMMSFKLCIALTFWLFKIISHVLSFACGIEISCTRLSDGLWRMAKMKVSDTFR